MDEAADLPVRPTKRSLDDLGQGFPSLDVELHDVSHALVKKAQQIPEEVAANGAERIRSIKDLVWFKCKVNCFRGAVTHLKAQECPEPDLVESGRAWWWIGAAGERRDDSAADFYKMLEAECARKAARGQPASEHLLPQPVDYLRLKAELAHQTVLGIRRVVRTLVHKSLVGGWDLECDGHGS